MPGSERTNLEEGKPRWLEKTHVQRMKRIERRKKRIDTTLLATMYWERKEESKSSAILRKKKVLATNLRGGNFEGGGGNTKTWGLPLLRKGKGLVGQQCGKGMQRNSKEDGAHAGKGGEKLTKLFPPSYKKN